MSAAGSPPRGSTPRGRVGWARVLNAIGLVALVAIVLPFAVFAVPQAVGAQQSYVVLSGSMQPAMHPGDVILVEDVDPAVIEPGDVVTFTNGDEATPTTHRVVEVVDRGGEAAFRTKGDANEDADRELVPASRLEGRVMSVGGHLLVVPAIGYVIEFAGTELGFALLVALPVALFAAYEIRHVVGSTRRRGPRRSGATSEARRVAPVEAVDSAGVESGGEASRPAPPDETADAAPPVRSAADEEVTYTLQPNELRLGLAVLVAFAAYSVWVAADDPTGWTIGVATAVGVATLMLGALYVFGGSAEGEANDAQSMEGWPEPGSGEAGRQPPGEQRRERRRSTARRVGRADGGGSDD